MAGSIHKLTDLQVKRETAVGWHSDGGNSEASSVRAQAVRELE